MNKKRIKKIKALIKDSDCRIGYLNYFICEYYFFPDKKDVKRLHYAKKANERLRSYLKKLKKQEK